MKSFFQGLLMFAIIFAVFTVFTNCGDTPTRVQTIIENHYYHEHERGSILFNIVMYNESQQVPSILAVHVNGWDKTFAQYDTMYLNMEDSVFVKWGYPGYPNLINNVSFIVRDSTTLFLKHYQDSTEQWIMSDSMVLY
jgi:hypothetical protein